MKKALTAAALALGVLLGIYIVLLCRVEGTKGIYSDKNWEGKANRYTGQVLRDGITAIRLAMLYYDETGMREWYPEDDFGAPNNRVPEYVYFNADYPACFVDFGLNPDNVGRWRSFGGQISCCMDTGTGKTAIKMFIDEFVPSQTRTDLEWVFYFPEYLDGWTEYGGI